MSSGKYKQCRFCDATFAGVFALVHHARRAHGMWRPAQGGQRQVCVCGAAFKDAYRLYYHYVGLSEESFVDHVLESRLK